ncbi:MAG: hypothetical protein NDI94_04555 [Candidatus Woesearchaeota archaeon]|nr:hypothetical protein [Candidatus Woesearchaeota archaeon]
MKKFFFLLLFLSLCSSALGLRISGQTFKYEYDFYPSLNRTHDFMVTNAEGYTADYTLFAKHISGADLRQYFKVVPEEMKGVADAETRPFRVFVNLPETLDTPGESETWIKVDVNPVISGKGIMALPSLAIRYIIFVPYPYKFLKWKFYIPNLNINETASIENYFKNYGGEMMDEVYANMTIISMFDSSIVKTIKTPSEKNVDRREERMIRSSFSSAGLKPGNYHIYATLNWDGNKSSTEQDFRIGSKIVSIKDFNKEFKTDSINRMLINVESGWNSKIDETYAVISIFEKDKSRKIKEFKSLNLELYPFQARQLEAYFDTNGIVPGDYIAVVTLKFEDESTTVEETIKIGDFNSETVTEMPNTFKFTPLTMMTILLVIFLIVNVFLIVKFTRPRKEYIPPEVIENIRQLRLKYSDAYIKDMMIKKGWEPQKVDELLRRAR